MCFGISHPKVLHSPPRTNLHFASPISRSMPSFIEKTREGILLLSSACLFLSKETLKFLWTGFYFKTNRSIGHYESLYQWWQLLQAARCACTQSWSAVVKVMILFFVAFQPMGIFRFLRNGESTFFQRCLQPFICLDLHPQISKSSFLHLASWVDFLIHMDFLFCIGRN